MSKPIMYPYPKIGQFKDLIVTINRYYSARGIAPQTLEFKGTIKLHGTNAAICYDQEHGLYVQSRKRVITPVSDNYGFAFFVEENKEVFEKMLKPWCGGEIQTVCLYGEWGGSGIQSGVALDELDKAFYAFNMQKIRKDGTTFWCESPFASASDIRIFNINDFTTYTKAIDFNNPGLVQPDLIEITTNVEKECPVGKFFGQSGVGEGVVWSYITDEGDLLNFKVKGAKHSVVKQKVVAPVDTEKLASIQAFVDYAVTENRVKQAVQEACGEETPTKKHTGKVIKLVNDDIFAEEMATMVDNSIQPKEAARHTGNAAREIFFKMIEAV